MQRPILSLSLPMYFVPVSLSFSYIFKRKEAQRPNLSSPQLRDIGFAALRLGKCFDASVPPRFLRFRFGSALAPLRFRFGSASVPLRFRFGSASVPLRFLGSASVPLRCRWGSASVPPRPPGAARNRPGPPGTARDRPGPVTLESRQSQASGHRSARFRVI